MTAPHMSPQRKPISQASCSRSGKRCCCQLADHRRSARCFAVIALPQCDPSSSPGYRHAWPLAGSGFGISDGSSCRAISPPLVMPTRWNPARRKHRPGSRLCRTFPVFTNVTMPRVGISGHLNLVAATASRIILLDSSGPSFLKAEQIHAPGQACFTYSANGQDVTQ